MQNNLIGAVNAEKLMVVKGASQNDLAVKNGIAENGSCSSYVFAADLGEKDDGNSSTRSSRLVEVLPKLQTRKLLK